MISYSNSLRYTIHRFVHPNKNWNRLLPLIPATHYICIQTVGMAPGNPHGYEEGMALVVELNE
jgi:hypothetical protein